MTPPRKHDDGIRSWSPMVRAMAPILVAAIAALGVSFGTRLADQEKLRDLEEQVREHHEEARRTQEAIDRLLAIGIEGFRDPTIFHAVRQQIETALKSFVTRSEWEHHQRRLKQLNPSIILPNGD